MFAYTSSLIFTYYTAFGPHTMPNTPEIVCYCRVTLCNRTDTYFVQRNTFRTARIYDGKREKPAESIRCSSDSCWICCASPSDKGTSSRSGCSFRIFHECWRIACAGRHRSACALTGWPPGKREKAGNVQWRDIIEL